MTERRPALQRVAFAPPDARSHELEVLSISELRARAGLQHLQAPQRVAFHMLLAITQGHCRHGVDFEAHDCAARSWVIVQPGQTQRWDTSTRWDGWVVLFRPEILLPRIGPTLVHNLCTSIGRSHLPSHLRLLPDEHGPGLACIGQLRADAQREGPDAERDELRRHQLHALLLRLRLAQLRAQPEQGPSDRAVQQFRRFQEAVDAHHTHLHHVSDYAQRLGFAEKTLNRLAQQVAGTTPKAYLSQRITLEAKRQLVHTNQTVTLIGQNLGFDETTNFVKFFKREVGSTPTQFRSQLP